MKAELKFECKSCIEDLFIDIDITGNILPTMATIKAKAIGSGWHIGRDCYCPKCLSQLTEHCNTCYYFEGNKSMGSMICRRDGEFTLSDDYCEHHKPM